MRSLIRQLWTREDGAIVSAEIMMIGTILVIGMIVGLTSVRDSVVTELADVAQAFSVMNQSFFFAGSNPWNGSYGGSFNGQAGMMGGGMMGGMGGGMGGMGGGMGSTMTCVSVFGGAGGPG